MNHYEELRSKFGLIDEWALGANESNEPVLVCIDEESATVRTLQDNGWMRVNTYHKDGTCEETYER